MTLTRREATKAAGAAIDATAIEAPTLITAAAMARAAQPIAVRLSDGHTETNSLRDGEPAERRGRAGTRIGLLVFSWLTSLEPIAAHDDGDKHLHLIAGYAGPIKEDMTAEEIAAGPTTDILGPALDSTLYYISAIRDAVLHQVLPPISGTWYAKGFGPNNEPLPDDHPIHGLAFGDRMMTSEDGGEVVWSEDGDLVTFMVTFTPRLPEGFAEDGIVLKHIFKVVFYAPNGWYPDGKHGVHGGIINAASAELTAYERLRSLRVENGGPENKRRIPDAARFVGDVEMWTENGMMTQAALDLIGGL